MQSFPMTSLERTKSRTWSLSLASKRKKGARGAGLRIADECQSACIRQLGVAKQMADDVCGKHSAFGVIAGQEFDRAEPVIFSLASTVQCRGVRSYFQSRWISIFQNSWPKLAIRAVVTVRGSGAQLGCTALRITLRLCSRYREFPTT